MLNLMLLAVLFALCFGCSQRSAPVPLPRVDAEAAATRALEQYDSDKNGMIAAGELDASPALKASVGVFDANRDGGVSADEISARIAAWRASGVALVPVCCKVVRRGAEVAGAHLRLTPEEFLGDEFRAAEGTTDELGMTYPSIPADQRLSANAPEGVQFGLYRVTIQLEGGDSAVLGLEVSYDNPGIGSPPIVLDIE
jgi:hypothetical protein